MNYALQMMEDFPPSLAAAAKIAPLPENFAFYDFAWLGDIANPSGTKIMKCTGCVFRDATRGKNKGEFSIQVDGSHRTVYVTPAEIDAYARSSSQWLHVGE